jgi:hypothetical protein
MVTKRCSRFEIRQRDLMTKSKGGKWWTESTDQPEIFEAMNEWLKGQDRMTWCRYRKILENNMKDWIKRLHKEGLIAKKKRLIEKLSHWWINWETKGLKNETNDSRKNNKLDWNGYWRLKNEEKILRMKKKNEEQTNTNRFSPYCQ